MRSGGHRAERLAAQIRLEIAEMIAGELRDPRLGDVEVTEVEMSPDYRRARVWIELRGNATDEQRALAGLESASGYLRRELSARLLMPRAPELSFLLDPRVPRANGTQSPPAHAN